jgi:hypothetical protein
MQDLSLNSNFSVHLNDRNDLATVEGRDAFEQSVSVALTEFMHDTLPGLKKGENIKEKITLQVTRVAREHDSLDSISQISVVEKEGVPDTYQVEIHYDSGDINLLSTEVTSS